MACHVSEFIRIHGGILPFTQQGRDKVKCFYQGLFQVYYKPYRGSSTKADHGEAKPVGTSP